jgi:AraC-like DNA-binding protein
LTIPAYAGGVTELLEPVTRDWDFARPVAGIAVLVEHAVATGLPAEIALAGTGLAQAVLAEPDREVTAEQELRVVRNLLRHGNAAARSGAALGRRYRLSTFGIAGYALVSSRTLLDAMNFGLRYLDLTFTFSIPHARVDGGQVVIEAHDDALPADVRRFLVARDLSAVEAVLRELFLGALPTRYDDAAGRLTFPASYLGVALPKANPAARALAEAVSADLATRRRESSGLPQQVRILLAQRLSFDPSIGGVATALALGERTLRRRLAADGTSFQRLLDEVRSSLSERMLGTGSLSVAQVAHRLGYAEPASFIHAHRRWHGETPGRRHMP